MSLNIRPIAASNATTTANPNEGRSASYERLAKAKLIAQGQVPSDVVQETQPTGDTQADRARTSIRRIKMKTQMSQNRHQRVEEPASDTTPAEVTQDVTLVAPADTGDTLDTTEQVSTTSEVPKPLSPQFAALAKAKRAFQLEKAAFDAEKKAFTEKPADTTSPGFTKEQIKANALSILREAGVTNEELTEAILRESQDYGPGFEKLMSEVQSLKEGLENQNKSLADRDQQAEKQVLSQMRREADQLVAEGDAYELVREAGYTEKAIDLIHRTWKKTGEVLDVTEALGLIENELLEDSLKFAKLSKVQGRLTPAQVQQQDDQAVKQDRPNVKVMRTLTNRDGASSISLSKRDRAIAAMEGRLK